MSVNLAEVAHRTDEITAHARGRAVSRSRPELLREALVHLEIARQCAEDREAAVSVRSE